MKTLASIFFVFFFSFVACAQTDSRTKEWLDSILDSSRPSNIKQATKYDFSPLWTETENSMVFGFIGDDYQRLRIKILSVKKKPGQPETYTVTGKSMVKNVVRPFTGTMKITDARVSKDPPDGLDEDYKTKGIKEGGVIVGEYHFTEDAKQTSTGHFDGLFASYWYIDRSGRVMYDDLEAGADGFLNNQFVGTWTSHKTNASKVANWGDYRIPLSGDLDMGAGEFWPDDKFLKNGWQSYRDAYSKDNKRAKLEEERKWWQ